MPENSTFVLYDFRGWLPNDHDCSRSFYLDVQLYFFKDEENLYVVWQGDADGDNEIYLYEIRSGITTQISNNEADDYYPKVNGDYVVWSGDGDEEVYLYQISTGIGYTSD